MNNSQDNVLKKSLTPRHIIFIAIGSAIGTGLFLGSASAIRLAGPSVIFAYMFAGMAVFMVMRALGEMALHKPLHGSFGGYASHYVSPLAGFITGWTWIFSLILVCIADVVAFSVYMQFWVSPDVFPPWLWSLGITLVVGGLNLCTVKIFGELEFWLTLVKVSAIVLMIAGGSYILITGYGNVNAGGDIAQSAPGLSNLWAHGGMFPNGFVGFVSAFAVVMFAFGGIEIIGLTAAEAENPEKNLPRAINSVPVRILLFYVGTMVVILSLTPWNEISGGSSPLVQIAASLGLPGAAHILNIVVISAAVSAMNSDIFGNARMMFGLAHHNQAPKSFTKINASGIPIIPVMVMIVSMLFGVVMNFFFPKGLFFLVASIASFATVWVWLMILITHWGMRRKMSQEEVGKLKFPVPFWPIAPALSIAFMVICICLLGINSGSRPALYSGAIWIIVLVIVYHLAVKGKEIPLTSLADNNPEDGASDHKNSQ